MEESEDIPVVPRARLSKTPSWITLGFILGALFVWALPRHEPKGATLEPAEPPQIVQLNRPKLTEIEAVFAEWESYAVWKNNVTQVALWDTEKRSFTLFYEVVRENGAYYFRSIPALTRPLLTRGVPAGAPLQFAETEESRRAWVERGQFEPRSETPAPNSPEP
jgi:hypothetical protein